jgi:hypothetical protein
MDILSEQKTSVRWQGWKILHFKCRLLYKAWVIEIRDKAYAKGLLKNFTMPSTFVIINYRNVQFVNDSCGTVMFFTLWSSKISCGTIMFRHSYVKFSARHLARFLGMQIRASFKMKI